MIEYSQAYITFSKSVLHDHRSKVEEWSNSQDPELKEASMMILEAGGK